MKIAIMQPYFLPYLGYFQLIQSVDKFIIYDDVSFIKGGWINRNNLLVNRAKSLVSIPLQNGNSVVPICEVELAGKREYWSRKILKTVQQSYAKAPHFEAVFKLFEDIIGGPSNLISEINVKAIKSICRYIGIETEILETSKGYQNSHLASSARVLDICKKEGADFYINAEGGRSLYSGEDFLERGIELRFLKPILPQYKQIGDDFTPGLSILDMLMYVNPEGIPASLQSYSLER